MVTRLSKIAICGHGRSGKDEAAKWLAANTSLRFGRSTSEVIAPHVAVRLNQTVEEAFSQRHANRVYWFDVGNELRAADPAFLVRETLRDAEISVGMRNSDEVRAARRERLVDLVLWIDREVPTDPTMTYGPELCDLIVQNRGTLAEFHERLEALATWAGLISNTKGNR